MKKQYLRLYFFLACILLHSVITYAQTTTWNTDGSVTVTGGEQTFTTPVADNIELAFKQMKKMNLGAPFMPSGLGSGGYAETGSISISNKGTDGFARLSVYLYNPDAPDKKGSLIYGVQATVDGQSNEAWKHTITAGNWWTEKQALSTDIKKLLTGTTLISSNADCHQEFAKKHGAHWGAIVAGTLTGVVLAGVAIVLAPELVIGTIVFAAEATLTGGAGALQGVAVTTAITGTLGTGAATGAAAGGTVSYLQTEAVGFSKVELPESNECFQHLVNQPVIMELTVKNATVNNVRWPASPHELGTQTPKQIFNFRSTEVLHKLQNPIEFPNYTIIAAHRGYWKDHPENSTASYDAALAAGADMVELDVRLTKDNVLVAFHDACLDRITTGTGFVRDKTWAEIQQLSLRDRDGNPTSYKMLSIEQALEYLRGRILINFDIKEKDWRQQDITAYPHLGWPEETTRYIRTLNASIQLAKNMNVLDQLVIKGKFPPNDVKDGNGNVVTKGIETILNEAGVSLDQITYTPVAFGWDTPKMTEYVTSYIEKADISGIELTYKTDYDPILKMIGPTINKNVRVGTYTYWPETANGVWAEDNVQDVATLCEPNARDYDYLYLASGSAVFGDGYASSTNVNKSLRKKPEFLNDGRGDWDFITKHGANFIITDRPALLAQYLEDRGLRKETSPVITEVPLLDKVTVTIKDSTQSRLAPLDGIARKIKDYRMVEFFTADTRSINIDCNLFTDSVQYTNGKTKSWCEQFKAANNKNCKCSDVYGPATFSGAMPQDAATNGQITEADVRKYPLHTLPEWSEIFPGYDIYVNANWFDVKKPSNLNDLEERRQQPNTIQKYPYQVPCTDVFGYMQPNSLSTALSTVFEPEPGRMDFDAFVWAKDGRIQLLKNSKNLPSLNENNTLIAQYYDGNDSNGEAKMALGGYILAQNGIVIPKVDEPKGVNSEVVKKRTVVAYKDNFEMMVATFTTEMLPIELANIMVNDYGYEHVFMFDAGGSSTMISSVGMYPNPTIVAGPNITSGSEPKDKDLTNKRVYRPVPTFLAIKVRDEFKGL
jgi:Glycerophosphoryl diester phosphodiesterase family/Phosphodiester glycosidase